ncbi:hypothetical protein PIB30_066932 [Stylosanthes scabra]|uniref:Uncharacterized protein n=1 Tax=Stylosanthes scabra TaxID=79078 RepID=A0ABU6WKW1_9FABA|nr:hypothetical protein [Stylosanthes scabra]
MKLCHHRILSLPPFMESPPPRSRRSLSLRNCRRERRRSFLYHRRTSPSRPCMKGTVAVEGKAAVDGEKERRHRRDSSTAAVLVAVLTAVQPSALLSLRFQPLPVISNVTGDSAVTPVGVPSPEIHYGSSFPFIPVRIAGPKLLVLIPALMGRCGFIVGLVAVIARAYGRSIGNEVGVKLFRIVNT